MPEYSPVLAVVTGVLEFMAAAWTLRSSGRKRILFPVGLLFLLLAGYQFAEVAVCANPGRRIFAQLAFFDITWLPPLAMWLAYQLYPRRSRGIKGTVLVYFLWAAVLNLWLLLDSGAISKSVCEMVIARFSHSSAFDVAYGIYYQSGLALVVFGAAAGLAASGDPVLRKHLAGLQAGVLGFVLPSLLLRLLFPEPAGILPSVMCHLAVVLAVFLIFLVRRERRLVRDIPG